MAALILTPVEAAANFKVKIFIGAAKIKQLAFVKETQEAAMAASGLVAAESL